MFIPLRNDGQLYRRVSSNAYGEFEMTLVADRVGWGPIYLRDDLGTTAVRADRAASKARAYHIDYDARIVIHKSVTPEQGDVLKLGDRELEIRRVHERMDIVGRLHHWEVDCVTA